VIGGLVMSTFATLLVLPSIFALVIGKKLAHSPSIYPDDPESIHYDPRVFINEDPAHPHHHPEPAHEEVLAELESASPRSESDVLVFLRRILDEARMKRHDMVTHYTVDDLRVALGFQQSASSDEASHRTGPGEARGNAPGIGSDPSPDAPHPHGDF
jgi:hypothetical protein